MYRAEYGISNDRISGQERGKTMIWTSLEFALICGEMLIEPAMALEFPEIVQAVKDRVTRDEMRDLFRELI